MKKLKKSVKNLDMFGHVVQINADQNQRTHKTLLGGIFSIIIYISLLDLITTKFLDMLLRDNNNIKTYSESYDADLGEGVDFNQTSMLLYHVLQKQNDNDGPIWLNESISQYLDIYYEQTTKDWTKK